MVLLDIKTDIKNIIHNRFYEKASPIFMKKVLSVVDDCPDDKESLLAAADKISKMISLFIDKGEGKAIHEILKSRIDRSGLIATRP
jgi:hypothetical protein